MARGNEWDLVSKLSAEERAEQEFALDCVSPDDGKYRKAAKKLLPYLGARAEWDACIQVQRALLATRVEFGCARSEDLASLDAAIPQVRELNIALLEEDKRLNHDQLAVLAELGLHMPETVEAILHPGTTSYDILDTARSFMFRRAWKEIIRPEVAKSIETLCDLSEKSIGILQVGRTHLQSTSPVLLGGVLAGYAGRIADRVERCDASFGGLRGKVSGIVGTGASVEMVIGQGRSLDFERAVLTKLGLEPDYTATQVVQKERLADVGHGLVTLAHVLGDLANDMRMLYSTPIGEVTSRDNKERLGGSSADATKNNPIQWENIAGKTAVVEAGMRVLYAMIQTDFQRDLRGSVQGRYQPQGMMVEVHEMFTRANRALEQLSLNDDRIAANLEYVRKSPGEAMTAILRGEPGWVHSKHGPGHNFVKETAKVAQKSGRSLLEVAKADPEFRAVYDGLSEIKQRVLNGELELYTGSAAQRAAENIAYARRVAPKV